MYSLDGIALNNPGMGWKFRGPSRPLSDLTADRTSLRIPGLPGVVANVDDRLASLAPPTPTLVVQSRRAKYETLLSLFAEASVLALTGNPGRHAAVEFLSSNHNGLTSRDEVVDVTATLRIPGVFWRDVDEQTFTQSIAAAASYTVDLWPMTGLVTDAVIRARGPFTDLVVASRGASFRRLGSVAAGSYLRYHCATGRAFLTTTDTWVGGVPVSGSVDAVGPGNKLAIYPSKVDELVKRGRVTVTTATRGAGAQIEIRGKGAYVA